MKVFIREIDKNGGEEEKVTIQCYQVTEQVKSIARFIRNSDMVLTGYHDDRISQVPLSEIFYVEAVDDHVFAYTKEKVFELKCRLYEFEALCSQEHFFRCSKSTVINLMQVDSVYPVFNGRYSAKMFNGEEIIISRQYVPALRECLFGGRR